MMYLTMSVCIWMLILPLGVWCQDPCPPGCQCSFTHPLTVFCIGKSFNSTTAKIPPGTVKYQYEAYEAEINLGTTNFSHLLSLESLHLSSPYDHLATKRRIAAVPTDQQRVLWPLRSLKELRINLNWGLETALPELFNASENLEILDLSNTRKLNYANLKATLVGLENSTKFKTLNIHNSQTLTGLINGFTLNLTDLLDPLRNCPLEEFDFSYSAIRTVVPGLISKAPRLKKLAARNNLLTRLISGAFFFELLMHPSLIEVDLSEQGFGEAKRGSSNDSLMFRYQMFPETPPAHEGLTSEWDYRRDYLNHPLYRANTDCISELLKTKNLCNIFKPECADFLKQCTDDHTVFCTVFSWLKPLTSFIPCDSFPAVTSLLNPDCGGCFVYPLKGNIQKIFLQKINNYDEVIATPSWYTETTCFLPNNSLEVLDFSHNREHGYSDIDLTFSTPIHGFDSMTVLNLSYNQMQHPSANMGLNLPHIKVFDLSYNCLDLEGKYGDFVAGAESVRELNLAGNVVQKISYDRFTTLSQIQLLNMSNNILQSFLVDIRNLSELSTIDLSANRISSLARNMTNQLSAQALKLKNKTGKPLMIDLSQNPLLCTCSVRDFTDWVLNEADNIVFISFNEYTCLNDASSQVYFHSLGKPSIIACLSTKVYIAVGTTFGILFSAITAAVVIGIYRKRWWIRYHYFLARRILIHNRKEEERSTDYRWDAFVSYNSHDNDWVDEVLQPKLEDENRIRLCLHERDFQFGGLITDLIIESIENSRKTILILTPHFVQSEWCKFEMRMAHQKLFSAGEDVLLLVILKPLVNVEISSTLKALLEQKNYVEWTEDEYGQKLFWAKLIGALNVPKRPAGAGREGDDPEAGDITDNDEARLINPSPSADIV